MNNDIAVVKIEDGFDFTRRIRGCDFIPKPVCYNNQSQTLENPGTIVSIAGWGTTSRYNDVSFAFAYLDGIEMGKKTSAYPTDREIGFVYKCCAVEIVPPFFVSCLKVS